MVPGCECRFEDTCVIRSVQFLPPLCMFCLLLHLQFNLRSLDLATAKDVIFVTKLDFHTFGKH